jgi:Fic family protein
MADLFEWLRSTDDHLLIRSCVFHYEFEFIHPFSDGNGRMGRLWQSLILGELHPLFAHLPVENMVYANQQNYYDAIQASTKNGESGPFIDFMLQEILNTLSRYKGENIEEVRDKVRDKVRDNFGITSAQIIEFVLTQPAITLDAIAEEMHCTRRTVEKHVKALREAGVLQRVGGNKNGHWEVNL